MSTDIHALDELGVRLEQAVSRQPRRRRRRWLAVGGLAAVLLGAPAVASVDGVFSLHGDLPAAVEAAVAPADPAATGRALRARGYAVRWSLIDDAPVGAGVPTTAREVAAPPPGTQVLSVLAADGSREIGADERTLLIEIAPSGSRILDEHR